MRAHHDSHATNEISAPLYEEHVLIEIRVNRIDNIENSEARNIFVNHRYRIHAILI